MAEASDENLLSDALLRSPLKRLKLDSVEVGATGAMGGGLACMPSPPVQGAQQVFAGPRFIQRPCSKGDGPDHSRDLGTAASKECCRC